MFWSEDRGIPIETDETLKDTIKIQNARKACKSIVQKQIEYASSREGRIAILRRIKAESPYYFNRCLQYSIFEDISLDEI